jgi:hypothetical protein
MTRAAALVGAAAVDLGLLALVTCGGLAAAAYHAGTIEVGSRDGTVNGSTSRWPRSSSSSPNATDPTACPGPRRWSSPNADAGGASPRTTPADGRP